MPATTTVPGKATGATVSEVNWDTHIAQNINALINPPRCRAYHNAAQSITNATGTAVSLNSEYDDTAALHDTATNNSRVTIPSGEDGWYLFSGFVEFAANSTGQRILYLRRGGTDNLMGLTLDAAAGSNATRLAICFLWKCTAGEYFELVVSQNSGGSLNLSANSYFNVQRVA